MFTRATFFKTLLFPFFFRVLFKIFKYPKGLHRSFSNAHVPNCKYQRHPSLSHRSDLANKVLIFNVEGALLKSSFMFPYFMLVAFEAGSILRSFVLVLLYPFIFLVGEEMGLRVMVMVCFFGIKKDSFRVQRAVLPKFFLEDVGSEAFEILKKGGKKVAVSDFPQVMIESFLKEYLEIDAVVGRELKSICGYFVGLVEKKRADAPTLEEILEDHKTVSRDLVGLSSLDRSLDHHLFSNCKDIYLVKTADKRSWQNLARDKYPKSLIFHDGRLAMKPTPISSLALFMWFPFGFILAIFRAVAALSLPYEMSVPILAFSGLHVTMAKPESSHSHPRSTQGAPEKGLLYVCNHRTLLDPLYLSFTLKKNLTAVTYSLSRVSEILSPIKTVRLTRNRERDAQMMERLLSRGDLVVCPEGTTCREPYLLRFSPLFTEMSDEIIPVALDTDVTMFYGTTAGGLKCLDPLYFLMNPLPRYTIRVLQGVHGLSNSPASDQASRFDVANHVQTEISEALGFECTKLTRRDKYLTLAGNEGVLINSNGPQRHV